MTERIKLTEDDISVTDDESYCQGNFYNCIYNYSRGEIDYEKSEKHAKDIKQQILDDHDIVERFRKLIAHLSNSFLEKKLEGASPTLLLLVMRDCVLNGRFDSSLQSWKEILDTQEKE